MGIKWVQVVGKANKASGDIDIRYSNGEKPQFTVGIAQGALAFSFKNAERLMIGLNDSLTRLYFCPTESKDGYKITTKNAAYRSYMTMAPVAL